MSTLRRKYEEAKRTKPAEPQSDFVPRQRISSPIRRLEGSLSSMYRSRERRSDVPYQRPQSPLRSQKGINTTTKGPPEEDFLPIRRIPYASSRFSAQSLYKSSPVARDSIGAGLRTGRVSKLKSRKKGVLLKIGLFVFNTVMGHDNDFEGIDADSPIIGNTVGTGSRVLASERPKKRVWFLDTTKKTEDVDRDLEKEKERYLRLLRSYELELRRLEDVLDLKDQELEDARLALLEQKSQENSRIQELEHLIHESIQRDRRVEEERISEHQSKLNRLEQEIQEQQRALMEETQKVEHEKSLLMDETERLESEKLHIEFERSRLLEQLKDIEAKRDEYVQLENKRKRVLEQLSDSPKRRKVTSHATNTPMRSRIVMKYKNARETIIAEKEQITAEVDENSQQLLQFLESLVKVSSSISLKSFPNSEKEKLLTSLEILVTTGHSVGSTTSKKSTIKLNKLAQKLNQYADSFFHIHKLSIPKKISLGNVFENLETNLMISLGKRQRILKKLDAEIFQVNLIIADNEVLKSLLCRSINECLKYLNIFERKSLLLEEILVIDNLLLKLNYLRSELELELVCANLSTNFKKNMSMNRSDFRDREFLQPNEILTSTPRNPKSKAQTEIENADYTLSPINLSAYFADLDKLVGTY